MRLKKPRWSGGNPPLEFCCPWNAENGSTDAKNEDTTPLPW
jgi:hypothetical protein